MSQETLVTLLSHTAESLKEIGSEHVRTNELKKMTLFSRLKSWTRRKRAQFVEREIAVNVPFQIRAMREAAGWTQQELAERTGKRQSVISQIENPGYGKLTLKTLRAVAEAFDVGLVVRFVPLSHLVSTAIDVEEKDLNVPNIENDHPSFESYSTESNYVTIRNTATPVLKLISNRKEPLRVLSITNKSEPKEIANAGTT